MKENVLEIKGLTKDFPGVRAIDDVSFDIKRNTVHCLVGENGAGKSTLIKILTGALNRTSGSISLNGKPYMVHNPKEARDNGVSTLFQELNVVDQLSVRDNLTLGTEDTKFGIIMKSKRIKRILETLDEIEPGINPNHPVSSLSVAKKQIIEITKAVASESDIIIMDEATASISEGEIERLFKIIKDLKRKNVTVIYISHRMEEIFEIGDYVTVLRDGKHIGTKKMSDVKDRSELIKMMIGKTVFEKYEPKEDQSQEITMQVDNVTNAKLSNISFNVKKGEIVGFYGLVGAGKTELTRAIMGIDKYAGEIYFKGAKLERSTLKIIKKGIALVPEERRTQGLFTVLTIKENIPVMNLEEISTASFLNSAKEKAVAREYVKKLSIMTNTIEKETAKLSGGNQQKVVFSKCLFANSNLLILDEPTRGIDVGAKEEIYTIVRQLAKEGKSIIICSSELSEIMNISDRIFLLYNGKIKAEMQNGEDIDSGRIIHICTGGE